jgi:hypothetical protein
VRIVFRRVAAVEKIGGFPSHSYKDRKSAGLKSVGEDVEDDISTIIKLSLQGAVRQGDDGENLFC